MEIILELKPIIFLLLSLFSHGESVECFSKSTDVSKDYLVANKELVQKLAEVYVEERYGKNNAQREKPYHISDEGKFWQVNGNIKPNTTGGVFVIKIDKLDGRVISFTHGK
ncbi:NTF2 fold immunity protein [Pseudocitrobacter corydidari]|uniref:NTF2 fold domain-containing protein n=1 Tax=Pseudocitrobacter corydidari TaxID=2891570 RepID=A0ABY3S1Q4_9ENTR|nr:NTF2 fold immunity protein [Pseudocitrobacter corydidari]UGS39952.1 hypothetical protein G163CM_06370 [Pseudocitrobacter corydidari]